MAGTVSCASAPIADNPAAPFPAAALRHAFAAAGRALHHLGAPSQEAANTEQWSTLLTRLERLAGLEQHSDTATLFDAAVQHAWASTCAQATDAAVIERVLPLFGAAGPELDRFRQVAVEELVMSNEPNLSHLLDHYRRDVRWIVPTHETPPLRWAAVEPVLRQFLQVVLPQALRDVPELCNLLPTIEERTLLDQARTHTAHVRADSLARIEALLAELTLLPRLQQGISASEGGTIEHVEQTIMVGQVPGLPAVAPNLGELYRRYQGFLLETFGMLDFRGILQLQNIVRLQLADVYVPLLGQHTPAASVARRTTRRKKRATNTGTALNLFHRPPDGATIDAPRPLHNFVRDCPFLVVLGDPGAGKSTLVRSILLALAEGQGYQRLGLAGAWMPVLFPVAAFAEARAAPGAQDLAPLDYLVTYYTGLSQPDYSPLFRRALETGRALVLFDGLDEVRDDRLALVRCLEAFVREWDTPGNRFVATSRIAGYEEAPLDDTLFTRVVVQPLDNDGIRAFIAQWSSAYERVASRDLPTDPLVAALELQRRIEERAYDLSEAVFTNPNVTALARSPLLLTILALIHQQGARLPDRRVDLYRLCVEALAETWNRSRSLSGREIDVYLGSEKLDERFVVNLLGPAALWMQEHQPGGLVERNDLQQQLARTLAQTDGLPYGRAYRLAQSFLTMMQYDTGLLQERGYQKFGFLHLTFEEYLAARALLESVTVDNPDALIHQRCTDPAWREVLRLMVAAASQREAQRLLLHMLAAPTTPQTYGRPVVLAGECLLDIGRNSATQRAWSAVVEHLVALVSSAQPVLDVRIAGSRVLGELDDPRLLHVRSGDGLAESYWCSLAAGTFWHSPDHTRPTLHPLEMPYSCQIARFPVTNAEYRCFVEAGGYMQRRWWTDNGWAFLQAGAQPPLLDAPSHSIMCPNHWDHPAYNSPAQPVVGVSWYEAAAYCAWLSEQGHQQGWLPASDMIRLPTSLEWERAARHTDQRHYPWGDEPPDTDRANYDAAELRAPTPVGCFPRGAAACGALDLAGNVWEWTASPWDRKNYPAPYGDFSARDKPVIRGGAFNWSQDYLHCGAYYWFSAGHRQNLLGFRVLWVAQHPA